MFKKNSDIHSHFTRSSSHYRSYYARINVKLFPIFCTGPTLWNKLPADLKHSNSLVAFKHLLKNALIIPPWSIEHWSAKHSLLRLTFIFHFLFVYILGFYSIIPTITLLAILLILYLVTHI